MTTATAKRPMTEGLTSSDARMRGSPMLEPGDAQLAPLQADYRRYHDPKHFAHEVDKLWRRRWLLAGREEDLPAVGDRMPVEFGPLSLFVVRAADDQFKAFYNSCLHRGTTLCAKPGTGRSIRCPFHGWEWSNDGGLMRIPGHWDFPAVTRANAALREVKLERWGGFLFVNADPEARPLAEALHVIPEHFRNFGFENRTTVAHVRKLVAANWKIAQETFMESYHAGVTHPETIPFTSDAHTQYDVWSHGDGHVGRIWAPSGLSNTQAGQDITPLYAAQAFLQSLWSWRYPKDPVPQLNAEADLRAEIAALHREMLQRVYGRPFELPDAVMMDTIVYFAFPNTAFFLTEFSPMVFSFVPHASDPNLSYFEIRLLLPLGEGASTPPRPPRVEMGVDDRFADHTELPFSFIGLVLDQDTEMMSLIQKGVRASDPVIGHSHLGSSQESIIRHWNAVLDQHTDDRLNA
jgi:phenylpropionate dioxygenase-like ring-hydroxylating dioxygenase large terminal subunit